MCEKHNLSYVLQTWRTRKIQGSVILLSERDGVSCNSRQTWNNQRQNLVWLHLENSVNFRESLISLISDSFFVGQNGDLMKNETGAYCFNSKLNAAFVGIVEWDVWS